MRLLLCLRYWVQEGMLELPHPLTAIFYQLVGFLQDQNFDCDAIRVLIQNLSRVNINHFVQCSEGYKISTNPLWVEYIHQTRSPEPTVMNELHTSFPQLLQDSDNDMERLSATSFHFLYWWLKFADHCDCPEAAAINEALIRRCQEHQYVCSPCECWFVERGYYAAYQNRAKLFDRQNQLLAAIEAWNLAIYHRQAYDRTRNRSHSSGAMHMMLKLLNLFARCVGTEHVRMQKNATVNALVTSLNLYVRSNYYTYQNNTKILT